MNSGQTDPRARQKARTRAAIVEGARRLREAGGTPTVAEAAKQSGVSRATAYRYFPTQESLLLEIADVTPGVEPVEVLLANLDTDDPRERLLRLVDAFHQTACDEEENFRRALWVYLDTWLRNRKRGAPAPAVREGRRMRWLDEALEPLQTLPEGELRRLKSALALTLGMDSLVVMKDVCGLEDKEARDVLRWVTEVLIDAGVE